MFYPTFFHTSGAAEHAYLLNYRSLLSPTRTLSRDLLYLSQPHSSRKDTLFTLDPNPVFSLLFFHSCASLFVRRSYPRNCCPQRLLFSSFILSSPSHIGRPFHLAAAILATEVGSEDNNPDLHDVRGEWWLVEDKDGTIQQWRRG